MNIQWLGVLTALAEDQDLVPRSQAAATNCPENPVPSSGLSSTVPCSTQTYTQANTYMPKIKCSIFLIRQYKDRASFCGSYCP